MNNIDALPLASGCHGCATRASAACSTPLAEVRQLHREARPDTDSGLLQSPAHVLSTLESDGTRRWLRPRLAMGKWWNRRRGVAYLLMIIFVAIPHIRLNGKPLILLDVVSREFTLFGRTFYPTDTVVLALFLLSVLISIVLVTAIAGRVWCGWACPQTVYMEFLFRPIDRFFEGTRGKGGKPRGKTAAIWGVARIAVYIALSMFLAHTFLAYFVGTEKLAVWIRSTPVEHPIAFLVMAATTGLMMFDFLYFREQMCIIACPYGRLQSVMLDEQSLIVAYDDGRGEPRQKGKRRDGDGRADCVDCHQCVAVCPTGIDIRDGLQMECINCTQCIDACDDVMDRVGRPRGLIRYSSQDAIAGKPKKILRARTILYPLILVALAGGFAYAVTTNSAFDARVVRGRGAPFTIIDSRMVSNSFSLRVVNRTDQTQQYQLEIESPPKVEVEVVDPDALRLQPGESTLAPFTVRFPSLLTVSGGNQNTKLAVTDESGNRRIVEFRLLGPRR